MSAPSSPVLPNRNGRFPLEWKVKAAAIGTYVAGLVMVGVWSAITDGNLIGELPDPVATVLTPMIPAVTAVIAGYQARHQWRTPSRSPYGQEGRASFSDPSRPGPDLT